MNILELCSVFSVLTIHFTIFKTGQSMSIGDLNKNASVMNCSLKFTSEKEHSLFNITIKNNRLIKLPINLTWTDIPQNASRNNTDITKSSWFLATEDAGKDLLLLDDQFEEMSLRALAISVGDIALTLNQIPENCLAEMSEHKAIETISGFLLKAASPERENDQNYEDETDTIYVCNGTITRSGICCLLNDHGIITCSKLEPNEWTEKFLAFVLILSLFIISQSVKLIPKSLYHERYVERRKIHIPIKLKIERTGTPTHRRFVKIKDKDNYENFISWATLFPQNKIDANAVYLFLDEERFVSQVSNTLAIKNVFRDCLEMFYDLFCKCNEDNSDFDGLKECCYYDLIHVCYNYLIKIIFFALFSFPFVIRLVFLNNFKESDTNLKTRLQLNCGLITYCLSLAILFFFIFSICWFRKLKSTFKKKLRQIIDAAMTENINIGLHNAGETLKTFFRTSNSILYNDRFSRCSLVKAWLTIIILCLPFSLLKLCFQIGIAAFPPLNMINRTLFELIYGLRKTLLYSDCICLQMIVFMILFSLLHLAISALMYLCTDVAVFFAKCFLYVMIGCLLNYDNLLVYFSFFVLISTYIFQSIREVNTKIRNFNKNVIKVLSNISVESQESLKGSIVVKRDGLFFSTRDVSYFFKENEHDKVKYLHVSRSFLNYLSSIPSPLAPGSRNWLYCKAFTEIVLMFLLLALVVVIVVSYGNATDLSSGMKTLITLGSGALLFFFNILLIRSFSHSSYEDYELLEIFVRSHIGDDIKEIWEICDFGNLSSDNTESNADLYCIYEHPIRFFTKESLMLTEKDDKETESLSGCNIFCRIVCEANSCNELSRHQEIDLYHRYNVFGTRRSSYSISSISEDLEHSL